VNSNLYKKAYFLSRRGLQELDLVLTPFVEERFSKLNQEDKVSFLELLENNDMDLMDWIINEKPTPKEFNNIVIQVKDYLKHERK
jgi:antitoxin CptB|tara:strand:+ start:292 stop:546 length:255 start_codon:yes stop_codon:yes gene_type:complete